MDDFEFAIGEKVRHRADMASPATVFLIVGRRIDEWAGGTAQYYVVRCGDEGRLSVLGTFEVEKYRP